MVLYDFTLYVATCRINITPH